MSRNNTNEINGHQECIYYNPSSSALARTSSGNNFALAAVTLHNSGGLNPIDRAAARRRPYRAAALA
jgi:hypothetical protein